LGPLGVRPFGRLLCSYTVNEIGDSVGIVALAVLVFDRTGKVAPTAALFLAGKFLPALIAPLLTARLDQIAVRRSLPTLYVVEAAVFVGLALIADSEFVLWPVLLLALIDGSIAVTARGMTRGAIAVVLRPAGLLAEGNSLLNIGFAVAVVGGSAAGGLVISEAGLGVALLIDAASFLLIAVVLAATRGLPPRHDEREAWLPRIRSGLEFAKTDPRVRLLLSGQCLALILFTLIIPIEVVYAKESLGTTSAGFGILLASWGAGIVLGSLLYVWVRGRSAAALILISTAAIGVAYLGMAGAQSLLIACLLSVVGGTGNGIQWISVMNAIQEATPTDYQARVVGLLESALAAMPGVGYVLGGAITAASSPRAAYAVSGIGVLVLVVLAVAWLPRLRRGREVDSRQASAGDRTITSGELPLLPSPSIRDGLPKPPPPPAAPSAGA
jgi:predicted MFS family arabinose efflux permease